MAFLAVPALAELGLFTEVAGTTAFITGSEVAGTVVSGAVAGEVGKQADSLLGTAIQAIAGQDTLDQLNKTSEQAKGAFSDILGQYSFSGGGSLHTRSVPRSNGSDKPPISQTNESYDPTNLNNNFTKKPSQVSNPIKKGPNIVDVRKTAQDLATFLQIANSQIVTGHPKSFDEIVVKTQQENPLLSYLVPKVVQFQQFAKPLQNNDEFNQVYSIYTGEGLSCDKIYITKSPKGNDVFNGVDEVGVLWSFENIPGRTVIPGTREVLVPPDVWTGPNSRNDRVPRKHPASTGNKISSNGKTRNFSNSSDVISLYSFFHDCGWNVGGNFNYREDLKLISRLIHALERGDIPDSDVPFAQLTIKYFSTIGNTLAFWMGGQPTTAMTQVVDRPPGTIDILSFIHPEIESLDSDSKNEINHQFYSAMLDQTMQVDKTFNGASIDPRSISIFDSMEVFF